VSDSLYYHCSRNLYKNGDTILPGSWGRLLLGTGPDHHRFYAEYLIERNTEPPNVRTSRREWTLPLPSRFSICDGFAQLKRGGAVEYVYVVQPEDLDVSSHRGDMRTPYI
jgi:hypothetical protein